MHSASRKIFAAFSQKIFRNSIEFAAMMLNLKALPAAVHQPDGPGENSRSPEPEMLKVNRF
jgi:hypothetical protein